MSSSYDGDASKVRVVCFRILRNRPPKIRLCTLPGATKMPTEAEAPPKDSATVYAAPARSE